MKLTPPNRYVVFSVKRMAPLMASIPTVAKKRPIMPPMIPLITLPLETLVIMDNPNIARAKYSGLENCSEILARSGAQIIRQTVLKMPPKALAVVESPNARPGCRCSTAMG